MYLIFEYPYDPAYGSIVVEPEAGANLVFRSHEEAESFARSQCIHAYVIIVID